MDAFWGPLLVYGGIAVAGIIVFAIAIPFNESNDRDARQVADVFMKLGGSIAAMGVLGVAIKLIGELIEAIF